ncbi:MAG: RNA polymerase sigma factor [Pseudomonadota bacterium]
MTRERAAAAVVTGDDPINLRHIPQRSALCSEMSEPGEAQALAWLKQRDSRGFDWAYVSYADRIFGFLVRLTRSRALAEDLFQHTFLRLAERGPGLRPDSDLRAWLFSVARNAFHSEARARGVASRAQVVLLGAPNLTAASPESGLALGDLERVLEGLEADDRELLLLVGVEGLNHAQLATILGVDAVTVRKRVSRARTRFAQALDSEGPLLQPMHGTRSP